MRACNTILTRAPSTQNNIPEVTSVTSDKCIQYICWPCTGGKKLFHTTQKIAYREILFQKHSKHTLRCQKSVGNKHVKKSKPCCQKYLTDEKNYKNLAKSVINALRTKNFVLKW